MKGIMVTLLMLMTTGIVVGQQSNSSDNSFGAVSSSAQNDLVKPLEIGVSADARRAIRSGKVLVSKIEPVDPVSGEKLHRNVISGISLFPEGKNLESLAQTRVLGRDDGDGVLRFGLSDSDLVALENNQLRMEFAASQRGKFQEIEVFYAGANRSTSAQQPRTNANTGFVPPSTTRPRNPTPQQRTQRPFGPRNNQTAQTPFIPSPGPAEAEPGEINFMGPALPPASAGNWTPPTRTTQRNPAFNTDRQNDFADKRNTGGWNIPGGNENGFQSDRQKALDAIEAKRIADRRRQMEYEEHVRRQQESDRLRRMEEDRLARLKWGNREPQTPLAPVLDGPVDNRQQLTPEQIAYQQMMWDLQQRENILKSREDSLIRKSDLLAMKENQLDASLRQQMWSNSVGNQPLRTNQPQNINPDWDRSNGIEIGKHYYPHNGPVTERLRSPRSTNDYVRRNVGYPESGFRPATDNKDIAPRVATNPTSPKRGINNYVAAVPAPGATNNSISKTGTRTGNEIDNRADRVHGFVLFLLLCSLGLNFYLAFISRGFYVRYHELADELRETFSTTH